MSASDRRGSRSKKDQENAARMKKEGIVRKTGQCPMCHRPFPVGSLMNHLNGCVGKRRR